MVEQIDRARTVNVTLMHLFLCLFIFVSCPLDPRYRLLTFNASVSSAASGQQQLV